MPVQSKPLDRRRAGMSPRVCWPATCNIGPLGCRSRIRAINSSADPPADIASNPSALAAAAVLSPTHHAVTRGSSSRAACATPLDDVKMTCAGAGASSTSSGVISKAGACTTRTGSPNALITARAKRSAAGFGRVINRTGVMDLTCRHCLRGSSVLPAKAPCAR